jgi:hypothetical protein
MAASKYEKYVIRQATPPDLSINWGRPDLGIMAPSFFLTPGERLKESDTMLEYAWVVKDSAFGVTPEKAPHKHDCDEIFLFMGINPEDPNDLGAEVEFWLGEGKETEKIKINTSSLVFIPKGLLHMPLFCRNVKKPILQVVIGLNVGQKLKNVIKYPVRGV